MVSRSQLIPNGLSAAQIVTAAPPVTAIFLIVPVLVTGPAKKAIDWPSGEKTGLVTAPGSSVPEMGLASNSEIDRKYKRELATYAICLPSAEIATRCRPGFVNC